MDMRGLAWLFLIGMIVFEPERTGRAIHIFWSALLGN
jgi:hypothetical protein